MTSNPIWPLHRRPDKLGILSVYVKWLASQYGVSYITFCVNALGIPRTDSEALSLRNPSDEVLERLSIGVGVPVADLRALHPDTALYRICKELAAISEAGESLGFLQFGGRTQ